MLSCVDGQVLADLPLCRRVTRELPADGHAVMGGLHRSGTEALPTSGPHAAIDFNHAGRYACRTERAAVVV